MVENWSKFRHNALHHLGTDGIIPADPYLVLPFRREELLVTIKTARDSHFNSRRIYEITEGTIYSRAEKAVHGKAIHAAIDYHVPYGTPVAAPVSGYAIASYQSAWLRNADGTVRNYQGKHLAFGLGYFVQIYAPEVNRYVQLGHLSSLEDSIPFSMPTEDVDGDWSPTNYAVPVTELVSGMHEFVVCVKRGHILGRVGFSGLRWGYDDYAQGADRPVEIDPNVYLSYDEPHVHFEEFDRYSDTGAKTPRRDPYDIYMSHSHYPTPTRVRAVGMEPLFYLDGSELPKFADDSI
ncbi:hypothetical protein C4579_01975 [Candidatus Microgenomates bacterium]|nr:MAG: hypothetical protein C4579_01975 [Candidatus Microgenomates bacterium]